ncbi:hypothetical protein C1Y63_08715 [Corynebacterium sp. 13CS0277]|uniref:alkaline shock response membrane anchor protein AmaP n=1 Tax=Corynebacterium sp. 13CS0277 TaxID=2071994 RepID=UPI000D031EE2|nr:alkaline shock response membrane anchor protein AmaP [Corynebacterium sp. 13CS0277]PRQ10936.1 hypothetical protein C1Y63_08715 [Corynebacterium sp. 13CS0277]
MSRALAGLDRLLTALLGLALGVLGTFFIGLYFDEPHAQQVADWLHLSQWPAAYDWEYLPVSLLGGGIAAILLGLWIVLANLGRRRIGRQDSSATTALGTISVNVGSIADAMAQSLSAQPKVTRANAKVVNDRKVKTLELTVTAEPTVDLASLKRAIAQQEAAFRSAVRDMDIASSYRIHLGPVER